MFEDPYADPKKAAEVVATKADWEEAARVHRESVVLLKNDGTLPLKKGCKVYAEAFGKSAEASEAATKALRRCWAMWFWWMTPPQPRPPC